MRVFARIQLLKFASRFQTQFPCVKFAAEDHQTPNEPVDFP